MINEAGEFRLILTQRFSNYFKHWLVFKISLQKLWDKVMVITILRVQEVTPYGYLNSLKIYDWIQEIHRPK